MSSSNVKNRILRFFWGLFPWLLVALILGFVIVMGRELIKEQERLAEAKKAAMKKDTPAVRVITLTVTPSQLKDKISLPGQVEPYEDLWVKAEVRGQVVDIMVEEGQHVRKGQILVQLDDRDYRSRLDRIEANYKLAKVEHDRIAELTNQKITAESRLDEAVARLKDINAQRSEARLALKRTRITAPIAGRVNEIKAKEGDLLGVDQAVAQILQIDKVKVTVGVPESDVAAVLDLREAEVVIEALDKRRVKGKKVFLARQPRSLARLYDLELIIPNPDGRILPGMFAQVGLVKQVFEQALTVPLYAVITHSDDRFVYVEKQGRAEKRPVELGVLVGWEVQVNSGLEPGDRVIVVGHRFLNSGQAVDVIKNVSSTDKIIES
ncbi:MAG: efflux RND transporter periplasmic adaptor subunit [Desulfobacteraceae bacterium]|jgi:RND family efflux transporter MFP subunit